MEKIIKNIIVSALVLLMLAINVSSFFEESRPFNRALKALPFRAFGLAQKWNLFSPNPTQINAYTIVVGENYYGQSINLKTQKLFTPESMYLRPEKKPFGHNHLSYYLSFLGTFLYVEDYRPFGNQLCHNLAYFEVNRWYAIGGEKIKKVHFIQVKLETIQPGAFAAPERALLKTVDIQN